jgi:hypothetical protein
MNAARLSGQGGYLADRRALVSVPGDAHHMDNFRRLLFKPAVVLAAPRVGRCFCGRSLINEAAQAAVAAPDFSERIRASLPTVSR